MSVGFAVGEQFLNPIRRTGHSPEFTTNLEVHVCCRLDPGPSSSPKWYLAFY